MEQPVELLSRCQAFVKVMYSILLRGITELDEKDQHERKSKAATWVVQFSWDIYCATSQYLNGSPPGKEPKEKRMSDVSHHKSEKTECDETVAAKMSEILEVSRLFLIQLGDDHVEKSNPFSVRRKGLPEGLEKPWSPWVPCESTTEKRGKDMPLYLENNLNFQGARAERQFLLSCKDPLNSADNFGETYLKLCGAIINTSHIAKHYRFAARIQAEVGEYHVRKGDFRSAAASFQKIVKVYRMDHWDRAYFWRIFRLAYCQRATVEPTAYLKTLCSCFSPRSGLIAPKKALMALFDDLQKVIEHPTVGNARYSRLLFIETSLSMSTPSNNSKVGKLLDQKQVEKRFCSVGENLQIPISIKSHLPGSIQLSSVKLFAVSVDEFTSILTNGDAVQEEDAAKVLSIDAKIQLNPGQNNYTFEWSPSSAGQYILSTVEIVWKQGYFYYDSMDLQEPMLSIDVLPSKPTHSISVEPSALVPGQDQEIRIIFEAGSDYVTSGNLLLSGTDSVLFIPPREDPGSSEWRKDWETNLKPCKPGEKLMMTAHVRCGLGEKKSNDSIPEVDCMDSNHGLIAKVQTTYLYCQTNDNDESKPASMKTTIESFTPVLDKTALSIESIETHWLYGNERFLLSVTLISNSPYLFSVDDWEVKMASPITIATSSNLNRNLLKRSISNSDQLSFAFECVVDEQSHKKLDFSQKSKMHLKLCADTGKAFSLDLLLDLDGFYSTLSRLKSPKTTDTLVSLKLEKNHGRVGEPVIMTFVIDFDSYKISSSTNDLEDVCFVYSIMSGKSDWLVGGKVNGIIELSKSNALSCVGIPIVPGMLDHFPTITLELLEASGSTIPINIDCHRPDAFQSMAMTEVNGVASPSFKEGR